MSDPKTDTKTDIKTPPSTAPNLPPGVIPVHATAVGPTVPVAPVTPVIPQPPSLGRVVLYHYPGPDRNSTSVVFAAIISKVGYPNLPDAVDLHVMNAGSEMAGGPVVVVRGVRFDNRPGEVPMPGWWGWPPRV